MTIQDVIQVILFFALLIGLTPVLGNYMYKVFTGQRHFMLPVFGWMERLTYKSISVNPDEESNWKRYTFNLLIFNLVGFIFLFIIQLIQAYLPLNPAHLGNVSWHSAFNTSVSFMTNTNWQGYSGETTLSYFVQIHHPFQQLFDTKTPLAPDLRQRLCPNRNRSRSKIGRRPVHS